MNRNITHKILSHHVAFMNCLIKLLYFINEDVCDNIKCHHGSQCKNGTCVCLQQCPELEKPVCASNDITYINECAMQHAGCELAMNLEVIHPDECEEQSGSGSGGMLDAKCLIYDALIFG